MQKHEGRSHALLRPEQLSNLDVSRRGLLQGAVAAAAIGFTASTTAQAATVHPNDARLFELADALEAVEAACNAYTAEHRGQSTDASDDGFDELCSGFRPLEEEIAATPAATMVGVLAKARAAQVPTTRAFGDCPFGLSIADDVWRLFGGCAA